MDSKMEVKKAIIMIVEKSATSPKSRNRPSRKLIAKKSRNKTTDSMEVETSELVELSVTTKKVLKH